MSYTGASIAVLDDVGLKVLLHKRADFRVWALPGGGLERDESPADAAVREVQEETGYDVRLDGLAAEFWYPQSGRTVYLYRARVVGGAPIDHGPETIAVKWFSIDALPWSMEPFSAERIREAISWSGVPARHTCYLPIWQRALLSMLIAVRDGYNRITGHP